MHKPIFKILNSYAEKGDGMDGEPRAQFHDAGTASEQSWSRR